MVVFGQNWLYSAKVVVIGQSCCIWESVVLFGQKWFNSGKSGCIRAKWLFLGKLVLFEQNGSIRAKLVVFV